MSLLLYRLLSRSHTHSLSLLSLSLCVCLSPSAKLSFRDHLSKGLLCKLSPVCPVYPTNRQDVPMQQETRMYAGMYVCMNVRMYVCMCIYIWLPTPRHPPTHLPTRPTPRSTPASAPGHVYYQRPNEIRPQTKNNLLDKLTLLARAASLLMPY